MPVKGTWCGRFLRPWRKFVSSACMRRHLALILLPIALAGCEDPNLTRCDEAIKARLKAPASFKRVSADGSGGFWTIQYDAVNSFNAPLRGRGHCFVTGAKADWIEDPDLDR